MKMKTGSRRPDTRLKTFGRKVKIKDRQTAIFLPDHLQQVRMIAMKGATDDEIAETFGHSVDTITRWRKLYPSFAKALESGRTHADQNVVVSLYNQTQGYTYEEEQAVGGKVPAVMTVKKFARPDTSAIQYWLNNRAPEVWRSARTTHVAGGSRDGDVPLGVKVETRNELIDAIVGMIATKPDGSSKPKT